MKTSIGCTQIEMRKESKCVTTKHQLNTMEGSSGGNERKKGP